MDAKSGNLPIDTKYKLISIVHCDDWQQCENCGKIISNVATIENLQGQQFGVGTECQESLLECDYTEKWKAAQELKKYNKAKRLYSNVRKGLKNGRCKLEGNWITFYNESGQWTSRVMRDHATDVLTKYGFDLAAIV